MTAHPNDDDDMATLCHTTTTTQWGNLQELMEEAKISCERQPSVLLTFSINVSWLDLHSSSMSPCWMLFIFISSFSFHISSFHWLLVVTDYHTIYIFFWYTRGTWGKTFAASDLVCNIQQFVRYFKSAISYIPKCNKNDSTTRTNPSQTL